MLDQLHAAQQVGDQDGALLLAERVEMRSGSLHGGEQRGVLLFGDGFGLGRDDIRKTHDHGQDGVVAGVDAGENVKYEFALEHHHDRCRQRAEDNFRQHALDRPEKAADVLEFVLRQIDD